MVYQISQDNDKRVADAADDKYYNKGQIKKKLSSLGLRQQSSLAL